jgi:hypothetical protein
MSDSSPRLPSARRDGFAPNSPDATDRELEQALATLRPSTGRIDRDRLMFLAGRAMVERPSARGMLLGKWLWPGATAVSTVAATVLGLLLVVNQRPVVVQQPRYDYPPHHVPPHHVAPPFAGQRGLPGVAPDEGMSASASHEITAAYYTSADRPASTARIDYVPRTSLPPSNYVQKRQVALALGVEALGSPPSSDGGQQFVAYRELLDNMLKKEE